MTVAELIEVLEDCDQDAQVSIHMNRQQWLEVMKAVVRYLNIEHDYGIDDRSPTEHPLFNAVYEMECICLG